MAVQTFVNDFGFCPPDNIPKLWAGHLPYGYQVKQGFPQERWGAEGPKATVVYVGDPRFRFAFVKFIFGTWIVGALEGGGCCAQLASPPCVYPTGYVGPDGVACVCNGCLYPDSFSMGPGSAESETYAFPCTQAIRPDPTYDFEGATNSDPSTWPEPVFEPCTAADVAPLTLEQFNQRSCNWPMAYTCDTEIEVTYCSKCTDWPDGFTQACSQNLANQFPGIPNGTFVDVATDRSIELVTIEGREARFLCEADGGTGSFGTGTPLADGQLQHIEISSIDLDITWSNVPLPNWELMNALMGTVNSGPIFGFPHEGVYFADYTTESRKTFDCQELHDITFHFKVRTAPCTCSPDGTTNIENGQIGLWNRALNHACDNSCTSGQGVSCCPWRRIYFRRGCGQNPNNNPGQAAQITHPYMAAPASTWGMMFQLPECG